MSKAAREKGTLSQLSLALREVPGREFPRSQPAGPHRMPIKAKGKTGSRVRSAVSMAACEGSKMRKLWGGGATGIKIRGRWSARERSLG